MRAEVEALPDQRAAIEDSCATCHMPMADYTEAAAGGAGAILDDGFLDPDHPLHELALDGVSCTLCHQIRSGNLGASANSGGYVIDTQAKPGEREIFGPFAVDEIQAQIMQGASGFIPVQSTHVAQSELCATCHTLYTPVFDAAGKVVGEFPEQVPYLEWFYSDYRQGPTCQGCHMPEAQGGVKVSVTSPNLRSPFAQHTFWGGNAYILGMLQAFGEELELTASAAQLEAARQGTLAQLQSATATIAIENLVSGGSTDQRRRAPREPGRAQAPDSLPLPAGVAAHHCRRRCRERGLRVGRRGGGWRHPGQRQRCRPNGLRAALPDDQPAGPGADLRGDPRRRRGPGDDARAARRSLSEGQPAAAVGLREGRPVRGHRRVHGGAFEDEDFLGGGDVVTYIMPVGGGAGPYTVTAELLFQTVGYRWAENLREFSGAEIDRFLEYYGAVPNAPVVIASASQQTP